MKSGSLGKYPNRKFLFIVPYSPFQWFDENALFGNNVPVSLLHLGSEIKARLHMQVKIVEMKTFLTPIYHWGDYGTFEKKMFEILSKILPDYDYIGISVGSMARYFPAISIARIIKQIDPRKIVIAGGCQATFRPEEFLNPKFGFDFIVKGEADVSLPETLDAIEKGEYLQIAKPVVIESEFIPDLNELVPIDWSLYEIPGTKYNVGLFASRGCPFQCNFCSKILNLGSHAFTWRPLHPERVIEEIRNAIAYFGSKLGAITFEDPVFGLNPAWRHEMLDRLIAEQIPVPISLEMRIDTALDEDFEQLAKLHAHITFGCESGSPQVLSAMNKTKNPARYLQRMKELAQICETKKIPWNINLLFGHPGENNATLDETFAYVRDLFTGVQYGTTLLNIFIYFIGTGIENKKEIFEKQYGTEFLYPNWHYYPVQEYLLSFIHPSRELRYDDLIHRVLEFIFPFYRSLRDSQPSNRKYYEHWLSLFNSPQFQAFLYKKGIPAELEGIKTEFWRKHFELSV